MTFTRLSSVLCAVLLGCGVSFAGGTFDTLVLTASTDKEVLYQYMPVVLTVKLQNPTDYVVSGNKSLTAIRHLVVTLTSPAGEKTVVDYRYGVTTGLTTPPRKGRMARGEEVAHSILVPHRYVETPGKYQIEVQFYDVDGRNSVRANVVKLRVARLPASEAAAAEYLRSNGLLGVLSLIPMGMRADEGEFVDLCMFRFSVFGDSIFQPYVDAAIAKALLRSQPRGPARDEGEALAMSLLESSAASPGYTQARFALMRIAMLPSATDSVRTRAYGRVIAGWPGTPEATKAIRILWRMIQPATRYRAPFRPK
ncbi:MAG: hypothetical protein HN849_16905 [Victivallales bacterium]|nr:hypothetical protein [Victivallales bacterium]MBT7162508.1 hypothetical protein [Victivallales bacterium]MBT7301203.1 hypothetical protein [Victivallales bacterium]